MDVASVATVNCNKPTRNISVGDEKKFSDRLNTPTASLICWYLQTLLSLVKFAYLLLFILLLRLASRPLVEQNLQMYISAIQLSMFPLDCRNVF